MNKIGKKYILIIAIIIIALMAAVGYIRSNSSKEGDLFIKFVNALDEDGDGRLSIKEFMAQRVPHDLENVILNDDRVKQFYLIDLNCDGYIDEDEMRRVSKGEQKKQCPEVR